MKILWGAPAGQTSTQDWIGLYKVGDADTAVAQWRQNTGGGALGNMSVKLPTTVGDYEFRYFSGTGNTKKATSRKVKVIDTSSYQMTPSTTSVATGATMRISWAVPAAGSVGRNEYDWIGLYKVGDAADAPQWRQNVGSRTSRSVSVQMPSVAGDYEFRYFLSFKPTGEFKSVKDAQGNSQDIYVFNRKFTGEYRKVATSTTVKVSSAALELIVLRTLAVAGESMKILWQSPAGQVSATDWIGLYKVGDADTAVAQWRHSTGGGDMGSVSAQLPSTVGNYEFRYFSGTGNMKKATSQKVTVVNPASYKLEASGTSVETGDMIGMLWQVPVGQTHATDWVGLYKVGDADTAPQWEASTRGKVMGSFSVQLPSTAGDYEFRYFFDKGYKKVATGAKTSAKVTVRASTGSGTSGSAGGKSSGRIRTEVIRYTYDGWDVIRENNSAKGITTYQNGLGIDNKLRSKNRRTVRYFLTDHLGSTEALTDSSGKIVSSTSYDSFGNATSNIQTSYRYTGREYDADTGLYYYRNRWYDPETGRFISKDPIGFSGGDINLYGYVGNNPLSFVDPYGNYACRKDQDPKKARLSLQDTIRYAAAVYRILGLLKNPNSDCHKYLTSLGFSPNKIIDNLMNSIPYDGTRSTNDTGPDFGGTGVTVKDTYFGGDQSDAVAAVSRDGKSIYYNRAALNVQTIIHENIHATNLSPAGGRWNIYDFNHPDADPMTGNRPGGLYLISDVEIQKAMGIPSYTARGSRNIDDKLKKEGCK